MLSYSVRFLCRFSSVTSCSCMIRMNRAIDLDILPKIDFWSVTRSHTRLLILSHRTSGNRVRCVVSLNKDQPELTNLTKIKQAIVRLGTRSLWDVIVAKQQVCRYPLTGLSSLRTDNKVDQQYPPAPLCLHAHIDQGLPLRSNMFTIQNRQSIEWLLVTTKRNDFPWWVDALCPHGRLKLPGLS